MRYARGLWFTRGLSPALARLFAAARSDCRRRRGFWNTWSTGGDWPGKEKEEDAMLRLEGTKCCGSSYRTNEAGNDIGRLKSLFSGVNDIRESRYIPYCNGGQEICLEIGSGIPEGLVQWTRILEPRWLGGIIPNRLTT
jgi:hypothetical protein